jgi:hypothetical protein
VALTEQQLDRYHREGYAIGGRLIGDEELARLRVEIDRIISGLPPDRRPENMPSLHYENDCLRRLFLSDPLVSVARQILGPEVALFTSYVISKRPSDGLPVHWHQDAAYFPIEPMETFTLWLAVDDSTRENGCMQVLPGSHRSKAIIDHSVKQSPRSTLPLQIDGLDLGDAVDVELRAGEFSAHDPFVLHGSNPNLSAHRRCGITIKYIPTYVRIDKTWVSPSGFDWANIKLFHPTADGTL